MEKGRGGRIRPVASSSASTGPYQSTPAVQLDPTHPELHLQAVLAQGDLIHRLERKGPVVPGARVSSATTD
eukprot:9412071-Pyramimonas_sp.AAC.1